LLPWDRGRRAASRDYNAITRREVTATWCIGCLRPISWHMPRRRS